MRWGRLMRRFVGKSLGAIEDFQIEDGPVPDPGANEVRIKVHSVGLGFVDALVMRGLYQVKPTTPFVPGGEVVGSIDTCGWDVEGWKPGDVVACWQFGGGLAEYAICCADRIVAVPKALDSVICAATILDYLTAYYGLFDRGGVQAGHNVLVLGAAGGVGAAAVQLAALSGARVVGAASSEEKKAYVLQLGAEHAFDYRDTEWRSQVKEWFPEGVDRVLDPVGGDCFEPAFRSLAKRGRHLVVGFASGAAIPALPANLALVKSAELVGVDARYLADTNPHRTSQIMRRILSLATSGSISPRIAGEYSLAQAPEAFTALADRSRIGKVVVRP